jgi:hypothetical protein
MARLLALLIAWGIVLVVVVAACFGMMVLVGLSSTAGDKYGPVAKGVGFAGAMMLIPAFKLGMWVARRKRDTR